MTDYVNIQSGDLDDAAAVTVLVGQGNLADHVEYGLDVTPDFAVAPPTFSLSEGKVYILVDTQYAPGVLHDKHRCLLTAHYDARTGISLPHAGDNYVWARLNMAAADDSPQIDVTDTATAPTDDSLHIATVNTTTQAVEQVNREPDGNFGGITADNLWVNESITWPDGVTTDGHPIAMGETINNRNDYYDNRAASPPGTVAKADHAANASHADTAGHASTSDLSTDSDHLGGYTADEVIALAGERHAQPWEPLRDTPYVDDSYEARPYVDFNTSNHSYDRYRVRLHVENDGETSAGLGCYVNGITDNVYNMISLLPRKDYGERVVQQTGRDTWTVGNTMAHGHSLHEFYVALPDAIVTDGPRRRFPLFNSGTQHTSGIGSYELSGVLTKSVRNINQIRVETGGKRLAIKAQIYGQDFFPG